MQRPPRKAKPKRRAGPAGPHCGLQYWATRAAKELARAAAGFEANPVHDLRVAIRRCRSLAEGLRTIDPAPGWKQFRALPKPMFSALGALRDTQVLQEWLERLTTPEGPARQAIAAILTARAAAQKLAAAEAMNGFNRKRWLKLGEELEGRARKLVPGSRVFQHLALERWQEAFHLHQVAMRTRREPDLHQLRIGIKRFRYTVENFLPEHHRLWSRDLKHMQDLLGEVHDLDVFLGEVRGHGELGSAGRELVGRIAGERDQRIQEYAAVMDGLGSLWTVWRDGLPSGRELSLAINAKLSHWSRAIDAQPAHSRRVAKISVRLWRALRRELGWPLERRVAGLIRAAVLFHDLGAGKRRKKQASFRAKMMNKLSPPVGWTEEEMEMVRLASRYGAGVFPSAADEGLRALSAARQQQVIRLAGILCLAHALERSTAGAGHVEVRRGKEVLSIFVEGFDARSEQAAEVAAARHLLEVAEDYAILIRPMQVAAKQVPLGRGAHA